MSYGSSCLPFRSIQLPEIFPILQAINPVYAYTFLFKYPGDSSCWEQYSWQQQEPKQCIQTWDMRAEDIRITWILSNWLFTSIISDRVHDPENSGDLATVIIPVLRHMLLVLPAGIIIGTTAAIIASQALISGSYT